MIISMIPRSLLRRADIRGAGPQSAAENGPLPFVVTTVLSLWLAFGLNGCDRGVSSPAAPDTIAVSIPVDFSAARRSIAAAEMALSEHCPIEDGREIRLWLLDSGSLSRDTAHTQERERLIAQQAVDDPSVLAYFGPMFSDQAKISIPILNRAGIAQVSFAASWPGLTKPGFSPGEPGSYYPSGRRTFFRLIPSDEHQAIAAALWAREQGYKRYFLVEGASNYSRGMAGIFREKVLDFGAEIIGHAQLPVATEARLDLLEEIRTTNPDLLYFAGDIFNARGESIYSFPKQLREAIPGIPLSIPEYMANPGLIEALGPDATDIYSTSGFVPVARLDTPLARRFKKDFEETTGTPPSSMAAFAYEAMRVLCTAIGRAPDRTRESVLSTLRELGPTTGLLGSWSFTSEGDISDIGVTGLQVRDGEWQSVEVIHRSLMDP